MTEGITVDLERDDRVIARLMPAQPKSPLTVGELNAFLRSLPPLGDDAEDFARDIRAIRLGFRRRPTHGIDGGHKCLHQLRKTRPASECMLTRTFSRLACRIPSRSMAACEESGGVSSVIVLRFVKQPANVKTGISAAWPFLSRPFLGRETPQKCAREAAIFGFTLPWDRATKQSHFDHHRRASAGHGRDWGRAARTGT